MSHSWDPLDEKWALILYDAGTTGLYPTNSLQNHYTRLQSPSQLSSIFQQFICGVGNYSNVYDVLQLQFYKEKDGVAMGN